MCIPPTNIDKLISHINNQMEYKLLISCLVDAIMAIKTQYQVKKNWTGDPCLPKEFIWTGLQCKRDGTGFKIISL